MGQEHSTFFSPQARKTLLESPVGEVLLLNRPLVEVRPESQLVDLLKVFRLKNISCVPIVRKQGDDEHRLIDIVDLVTFITNSYAQLGSASFKENLHSILKVQCNQLADFSTKNPTHVVPSTVSVASAILKMTELRIYRLALTDPSKRITHLVTQSNVTEFVLLNIDHLHPEPDATLRQLSLTPTTPVVACRETEFTMEVLLEMRNKRVTALPIVDGRGVMTGMMTVRHLKTLTPKTMSNLFLPITQFLSAIGATYVAGSLDMPLRDLLRVMVVNMYHHLFFLDDNGRVEGVITLSDLIRWCLAPTL